MLPGLALTIFGTGFANFFGEQMIQSTPGGNPKLSGDFTAVLSELKIPFLSDIPYIGKVLFSHNMLVYLAIAVAIICWFYIKHTRAGLRMRSVGENPAAADASGVNVNRMKYFNIILGGGICGLGGAYIALINGNGVWNNGCVNGQGWISVALVIFASWSPAKALLGSLVFGAFSVFQVRANDFATAFPGPVVPGRHPQGVLRHAAVPCDGAGADCQFHAQKEKPFSAPVARRQLLQGRALAA